MADKKIVGEWIEKADEDFGYARASLEEELEFFAQICFHFHQAAEKYLKAYVIKHDLEFKKIHDLLELLDICCKHEAGLMNLKENCAFLNRFYIFTRYPVHWHSSFSKDDAEKSKLAAETIGERIKPLL